jgi:hypothetical protein
LKCFEEKFKIDFKTLIYSFFIPLNKLYIKYFYAPWDFMATWTLVIKVGFRAFILPKKKPFRISKT